MRKTIRYNVEGSIPLNSKQKAELEKLAQMTDDEIDTSDILELDENFFKQAVQNPFYKPTKTPTTIRLDSDVLNWLKSQGKGYQTRINNILREAMLASYNARR
ncbi:cytoplasmic protein [Pasteurellaceae bacterium 15-036681]|nr:cytoplasmic protein [Pasteurellaceae bacterium 15-036681]